MKIHFNHHYLKIGEPLPHRDKNGVIFLWDDAVQGPPPPVAPRGTRIDPYGNIIHDELPVTPFPDAKPVKPPIDLNSVLIQRGPAFPRPISAADMLQSRPVFPAPAASAPTPSVTPGVPVFPHPLPSAPSVTPGLPIFPRPLPPSVMPGLPISPLPSPVPITGPLQGGPVTSPAASPATSPATSTLPTPRTVAMLVLLTLPAWGTVLWTKRKNFF